MALSVPPYRSVASFLRRQGSAWLGAMALTLLAGLAWGQAGSGRTPTATACCCCATATAAGHAVACADERETTSATAESTCAVPPATVAVCACQFAPGATTDVTDLAQALLPTFGSAADARLGEAPPSPWVAALGAEFGLLRPRAGWVESASPPWRDRPKVGHGLPLLV